jgi:2-hydroxyglutarate dehydrogenase
MFTRHLKTAIRHNSSKFDLAIVGGGIVGSASAREIKTRFPDLDIIIVEKESEMAMHQSGNNSGVIHAGLYYPPGSYKAKLCREGLEKSYKYFDEHKIPYRKCGKIVVATKEEELGRLDILIERSKANGVNFEVVDADGIKQLEPNCRGIRAISSPDTGIVDWGYVSKYYVKEFQGLGGHAKNNFEVTDITPCTDAALPDYNITIQAKNGDSIHAKNVITCAGLYSDKIANKTGAESLPKIVPFRGEYLLLKPGKENLVNGNIYPVPDPNFPFLGVHYTPRMDGSVWLGPNAFLSFRREGYKFTDFKTSEFLDAVMFPGLWKLVARNLGAGFKEVKHSMILGAQVKELQKFIPAPLFTIDDVVRGPAGVRAQALGMDGNLVEDFIFDTGTGSLEKHVINVRNAPSPAATSSLAIARVVAERVTDHFGYE